MNYRLLTLITLAAAALTPLAAQAQLKLNPGDRIAILGGTTPDRMQHSGWFDTLVHAANPDKDIVMRSLAFSGDEVGTWHRVDDFGTRDEWLTRVGADVILAFYGFNESYKGQAGLDDFKKKLDQFCKDMAKANYRGKGAPRLVLISPIAAEKQANPDVADAAPINANLALYTAAMAEVAKANQVPFVDMFGLSQQTYAEAKAPLTFNGIHLTAEGDKELAPGLFKGVFGEAAPNLDSLEKLRKAVIARNDLWHSRYRTVDGYNVYGGRSGLAYAAGIGGMKQNERNPEKPYVSNFQIMQQEMTVRDLMTSNREAALWAIAKGGDGPVDDSNLPKVDPVGSNLPVGGDTFNKTPMSGFQVDPKTGLVAFPSGEEVIPKIKAAPGLKIQLFADEKMFPELVKPVQMGFDTKGRLWVSAWKNYPERTPDSTDGDKLLIFEDTNNDGRADKCITFYDQLNCPTGFQFYKDGVLVMRSPDLLWLRDTDGDDKVDIVERVLSGLCAADSHHETNAMCYEPGGAVYCSDGVFHRSQVETPQGPVRNTNGSIYRYEPRTGKFIRHAAYGFANPHGRVFDEWGNDFITDATGNANYFGPGFSGFIDGGDFGTVAHNKYEQWWQRPSRPCPATTILSSRHFPEDWNNNFINFNVISIQGIHRVKMEEDGSAIKGTTITYQREGQEMNTFIECDPAVVGTFRPICGSTAPDGSFFFADWSCAIIGHMQHHLRDPNRDHTTGRVYRVTYEGRPLTPVKQIHGQPITALLDLLKEPEIDVRMRAKIELDKHDSQEVVAATQQWLKQFDAKKMEDAHHLLEALWVHQWHNVVNTDLINAVFASPDPRARAQAVRVALYQRDRVPNVVEIIEKAAADTNARVRLEAVRACSFFTPGDKKMVGIALSVTTQPLDYTLDYCLNETLRQIAPKVEDLVLLDDEAAQTWLLSHVKAGDLPKLGKSKVVLQSIIDRADSRADHREQAINDLVALNQSNRAAELALALQRVNGDKAGAEQELAKLLLQISSADLAKSKDALETLSKSSGNTQRRTGLCALVIASGDPAAAWNAGDASSRIALLEAAGSIPDAALRAKFFPLAVASLEGSTDGKFINATLRAMPLLGNENAAAAYALAAGFVKGNKHTAPALYALARLKGAWKAEDAAALTKSILADCQSQPANKRTTADYVSAVQVARELAALLPKAEGDAMRAQLRQVSVDVVVVKTVREQLRFDTNRIVVAAGKQTEIIFENDDVMPHNLLIVDSGSRQPIGMKALTMSPVPDKEGRLYIPDDKQFKQAIRVATKMLEPGQTERLQFKAPNKEMEFEFVCTFPGHFMTMGGKLIVTKDVDAYLAAHPVADNSSVPPPVAVAAPVATSAPGDYVVYEPKGAAKGKHIVLLSGDEEYRSEEAMPMLGKILSQHHGFKCTVLFSVNDKGEIDPDNGGSLTHPDALDSADAIVMLLRFRHWDAATLAKFDAAMKRGVPIIALRTSTHAFNGIPKESPYAAWNFNNDGGFGKKFLGETWVSHWGKHKSEATRGVIEASHAKDPILKGVTDLFGDTDVYEAHPPADARVLVHGTVLSGMTPDSPPADYAKPRAPDKKEQGVNSPMMPIAWTRVVKNEAGTENKIFCTTMGAATDLTNESLRRMCVNAVFWGLNIAVPEKADVTLIGDYKPSKYGFKGYQVGVKPAAYVLK